LERRRESGVGFGETAGRLMELCWPTTC